jgi:hypothetical protein
MKLWEIGWEGVESIHVAQHKGQWWVLVNTVRTLRFQKGRRGHFLACRATTSFSRRALLHGVSESIHMDYTSESGGGRN